MDLARELEPKPEAFTRRGIPPGFHSSRIKVDTVLSQLLAKRAEVDVELEEHQQKAREVEWEIFREDPRTFVSIKAGEHNSPPTNRLESILGEEFPVHEQENFSAEKNQRVGNLTLTYSTTRKNVDRVKSFQDRISNEIADFEGLQEYLEKSQVQSQLGPNGQRREMKRSASGRVRTVNPMDLTHRSSRCRNTGQASNSASGQRNVVPNVQTPSHTTGTLANPQLMLQTPNSGPGFLDVDTSQSVDQLAANIGLNLETSAETLWMGGNVGSHLGNSLPPAVTPQSALAGQGNNILVQVSQLLHQATLFDLFQIQQLVEANISAVSNYLLNQANNNNQPQTPVLGSSVGGGGSGVTVEQQQQHNDTMMAAAEAMQPMVGGTDGGGEGGGAGGMGVENQFQLGNVMAAGLPSESNPN